jgi:hypothetical protein
LDKQHPGDVIIHLPSMGTNPLAIMWKVAEKFFQHIGNCLHIIVTCPWLTFLNYPDMLERDPSPDGVTGASVAKVQFRDPFAEPEPYGSELVQGP